MKSISSQSAKLWNYFKGFPFKGNIFLFATVLFSAIVFTYSPTPILKIIVVIPLAISLSLVIIPILEFVTFFSKSLQETLKLDEAKKIHSSSLTEEMTTIASKMGIKKNKGHLVKVMRGWLNAAVRPNGNMILGQPIVEEFEKEEREGLIGHEFGHIKGHHLPIRIAILIIISPLFYLIINFPFPYFINYLILFSALGLILPLISWPLEFHADTISAKYVGTDKIIAGLLKLADKAGVNKKRDSYTHPSINRRINRLRNM